MKTLILNGSPRKNGDVAFLVEQLASLLPGQVIRLDAFTSGIQACQDCRYCKSKSGCALQDPMQHLYRTLDSYDNIVLASPVYFSDLTPPLLAIGSRLQASYMARRFRNEQMFPHPKNGGVILTGGGDGNMTPAWDAAVKFLRLMNAGRIAPLAAAQNTDHLPVADDRQALDGVRTMARWFIDHAGRSGAVY